MLGTRLRGLPGPILVTGHTGFKGTWLTFLLERLQVPVIGFSLPPEKDSLFDRAKRTGLIPEEFADICDLEAVSRFLTHHKPSAIIHLAAQPLVLESYKTPRETFETNVMGTVNVLDVAFKTDYIKAILVVTTDKVYKNDNSGSRFIESDSLEGKDPYSASKVGTESAVAAWQQISKVSGGPKVLSLRAGNVIGGGDWGENRLIPELIRGFTTSTTVPVRNPHSSRPWQHVLDPLRGYLMALEAVLGGQSLQALNFGPDSASLSVRDVVEVSTKVWPTPTSIEFADDSLSKGIESINLQLDSNHAKKFLGWKPCWNQNESVIATIRWWDSVLNKSLNVADTCHSDIDFMFSRTNHQQGKIQGTETSESIKVMQGGNS